MANCSANVPTVPVRRRLANVATPFTADTVVGPLRVAPAPVPMDTVTAALDVVRLPSASRSSTTGCVPKLTPLAAPAGPVVTTIAATAPEARVTVPELTAASEPLVNRRTRAPAEPLILRLVNVAMPFTAATVAVPLSVPPPDKITAVTLAAEPVTTLLFTSRISITGCVPNTAPLTADADGCVLIASCVAAPGVKVTAGLPVLIAIPPTVAAIVAEPLAVDVIVVV